MGVFSLTKIAFLLQKMIEQNRKNVVSLDTRFREITESLFAIRSTMESFKDNKDPVGRRNDTG
jgi:hypothetical protein